MPVATAPDAPVDDAATAGSAGSVDGDAAAPEMRRVATARSAALTVKARTTASDAARALVMSVHSFIILAATASKLARSDVLSVTPSDGDEKRGGSEMRREKSYPVMTSPGASTRARADLPVFRLYSGFTAVLTTTSSSS